MFSESRLWECSVFTVFADKSVMFLVQILQVFLRAMHGNVVFSHSKMHVRHKCLVFFRSLSICSCSLRLCRALRGFGRYWKSCGGSGMVWKALEGSAGFARFCEALVVLRGFGRLCEVLDALEGFGRLWLWKALGSF